MADHRVEGTRIWCARVPYDVTEERDEVVRLIDHSLSEPGSPNVLNFQMAKNHLDCSLIVHQISAVEPFVR
jgi:hypothetical protein